MFNRTNLQLIGVSFLILFLELLLIRLVSTEIRIFAYLSNSILIAAFVGTGLGMLIKRPLPLFLSAVSLFLVNIILATQYIVRLPRLEFKVFSGITELLAPLSDSYIWLQTLTYSKSGIVIGLFLTLFILTLVCFLFMPLGQYLGSLFNKGKKPIFLYSLNVGASIFGMWTFNGASIAGISPYFGLVLCMVLILFLSQNNFSRTISIVALVGSLVLLTPREAFQPYDKAATFWSPYQKLTLSLIKNQKEYHPGGWYLEVNNVGYMGLLDLSEKSLEVRKPEILKSLGPDFDLAFSNQYSLPYKIKPGAQSALIIGGGAGNDAAAALRAKVQNIDLVEIDPRIVDIGRKYHPEKPYESANVHVTVDDGRAFLERTKKKYQIIIMSLADSHTSSSSLSNVQLDNYLYTVESLKKVKEKLTDDGVLFLTFEVTRPWIGERIEKTVNLAFGHKPLVADIRSEGVFGWGGVMFIASKNPLLLSSLISEPNLNVYLASNNRDYSASSTNALTDNWPYIYLDKPRIPVLHSIVAVIALAGLFVFRTKLIPKGRFNLPFFLLGAGFMLFEVQNIIKSALLFGNNWVTNLLIITGVLLFILAANLVSLKNLVKIKYAFLFLFAAFLVQAVTPLNFFNQLGFASKMLFGVFFLTLPHFFSGIIFATLFAKDKERAGLMGSNLIGSAVGGFLSISSYLLGTSVLLYSTMALYALGYLFTVRKYKL